jgi:3-phenylpropionate/trans-cinnamate dioxygenase ferredoxin component
MPELAAEAIPNGTVVPIYLDERKLRVAVARVDDRLYAFDDICTCADQGCPLSGGLLDGTTLLCQCHGSRWDIATGELINGPATKGLITHEVRETGGDIQVGG